ncbi:MAG: glycerol-3-phosphate 1-O-acyltransferase PlsY [Chloroflexi bacterium]|nr:glycerol-3-phosphate 1-O-acyltransferase PlsY [Chloroflexota bacterium]
MASSLVIPLSYLLGAIPFGLLVARLVKRIDVRRYGSGNTGTTNVLRTTGLKPALAVLLLDAGKGVLAVMLAKVVSPSPGLEVAAAIAVLVGHNWSVFIHFQGGKGTATGMGALCTLSPLAGLIVLVVGLPFIAIFRYISLGSIVGAVAALVSVVLLASLAPSVSLGAPSYIYIAYPAVGAPMLLFKHRGNIARLLRGQERKLGESVKIGGTSAETPGPNNYLKTPF